MTDELKRIRVDAAKAWAKKRDDNIPIVHAEGFAKGFDFALTQLDKVPEVMGMREALDNAMAHFRERGADSGDYDVCVVRIATTDFDKLVRRGE